MGRYPLRRTWVTRHDDDENDDDDEDKPPLSLSLCLFSRQRVLCTQPVRRVSRASCPPVSWRGALERATSAWSRTLRNLLQPRTTRVKRGNFRLAILPCVFSFVTGSTHSPLTASNEPRYLLIEASSSIYSKENFLWIVHGDRDVHAIVARDPLQSIFLELFSRVCTWKLFDDRESYVVTSFVDVIAFPAARCIGTVVVIEDVEGSVGTLTACRNLERLTELVVEDCTGYVHRKSVIDNGLSNDTDSCDDLTNGQKMAPVLGVPPPPPPAPHMGPDGLILPRKPYNPYLTSSNHKDLRRELLFNQKVGKNVLNQKSELQRALEKQREAASRREAERNREENYKDDPRTALQRAIEQRAKHIEMALEQSQPTTEPPSNLLVTARAKLRPRTDSQ